jgi:hypothetical protein
MKAGATTSPLRCHFSLAQYGEENLRTNDEMRLFSAITIIDHGCSPHLQSAEMVLVCDDETITIFSRGSMALDGFFFMVSHGSS